MRRTWGTFSTCPGNEYHFAKHVKNVLHAVGHVFNVLIETRARFQRALAMSIIFGKHVKNVLHAVGHVSNVPMMKETSHERKVHAQASASLGSAGSYILCHHLPGRQYSSRRAIG